MMDVEAGGEWLTVSETGENGLNTKIEGLRPGHLYQFEIYAINKEGLSLPLRTRDPIKAENPYKPPSQPREPHIVDFDHQSVTMRWTKPADDGGRPITHYIIQKKDKFGGWFDALVTDNANCEAKIDELEARVPGLSEGKWYQFRIVAANKAGESLPSQETKPHLCRHKNCKPLFNKLLCRLLCSNYCVCFITAVTPCIDKGTAGSKTVKVHRSAIWQVKVRGEPPPTFTWLKDGRPVDCNDDYMTERHEYQGGALAILHIPRTQFDDAGTYTLKAENRNGSDKIDLDLIVLDPMKECDCDMFKRGNLGCSCSRGFRQTELSATQILVLDFGEPPPNYYT